MEDAVHRLACRRNISHAEARTFILSRMLNSMERVVSATRGIDFTGEDATTQKFHVDCCAALREQLGLSPTEPRLNPSESK